MALVTRRTRATRSTEPEEAEAPRRGRRGPAEEEAPARRRRSAPEPKFSEPEDDGAYVDEDEAPARGRGSRDAGFRRGASEGRGRSDEAEAEAPRRGRRSSSSSDDDEGSNDAVQSGWGAAKKLKAEGGSFADEVSITGDEQLVVFLEDAPYAIYKQHWVEGLRSTKKKSFICPGSGCPLCAIGESASKKWAFNVALIEGPEGREEAVVKSLIAGTTLFDVIAAEHEGSDGPLDEGVWSLSKSGKKSSTNYRLKRIEGRKLEAAFGLTDEDVDQIVEEANLEPYTKEQHRAPARSHLQELADELTGGDD